MHTSKSPNEVIPEWEILKSLRQHRMRLWDEIKYQKLDLSQISLSEIERQSYLDLLEDGLRNVMRRRDLDSLLGGGLDETAMDRAHLYLRSLCVLLERNSVNLGPPEFESPERQSTRGYSRLNSLLNFLENTNNRFTLVSGTALKLFQSNSPKDDMKEVERFNDFFDNLTKSPVEDISFSGTKINSGDIEQRKVSDSLTAYFDGLDLLLLQLEDSPDCRKHDVLLRLPDFNADKSPVPSQVSRMELFFSNCRIPSLWLSGQLDVLSFVNHLIEDLDEEGSHEFSAGKQPSSTLKELLERGAFNPWILGYEGTRFSENEKQNLAVTLVESLVIALASGSMIKCWDSDTIYFLAEPNGECQRRNPYALCTTHSQRDLPERSLGNLDNFGLGLKDKDFEKLAKLLLEIKSGFLQEKVPSIDSINREIYKNIESGPYLRAVHDCLVFRRLFQRHSRLKSQRGQKIDALAVAREMISKIINGIRSTRQRKRLFESEDEYDYQIFSNDALSSNSNKSASQYPFLDVYGSPYTSNLQSTHSRKEAPKRVKFKISSDRDAEMANTQQTQFELMAIDTSQTRRPEAYHNSNTQRNPHLHTPSLTREIRNHCEYSHEEGYSSILHKRPCPPAQRSEFQIAIICALSSEADAVECLFDDRWDAEGDIYGKAPGDPNAYSTGLIGRHNVVLAYMPGMGKGSAASVATNCLTSFRNIKLGLVVGICGGVPFRKNREEILLGDVVISTGIIQYDLRRQYPEASARKNTTLDNLSRPSMRIRSLLSKLQTNWSRARFHTKTSEYLGIVQVGLCGTASYPGLAEDRLFDAGYHHKHSASSGCSTCTNYKGIGGRVCEVALEINCDKLGCDRGKLIARARLDAAREILVSGQVCNPKPSIHFGLVASGDTVMKSGQDRDTIGSQEDIIAFEMEGAGVWDIVPCLVIKGVCDYADSHKNKIWQNYAAATAAACTKAFLDHWSESV
ncbi:hypothetical protein TWF694_011411 [Orbilia ellipsospora]|uniref:Nucleoside phosphorylase domain-containing protein n=1 Tax=Orbilia ellipsospora TaxID=2528407 RepID=A0AAV9X699_9PEZI